MARFFIRPPAWTSGITFATSGLLGGTWRLGGCLHRLFTTSTEAAAKLDVDRTVSLDSRLLPSTSRQGQGNSAGSQEVRWWYAPCSERLCPYALLAQWQGLCPRYQAESCQVGEETCGEACAVLLQSGRACGGRDPASKCWGKRALKESEATVASTGMPPLMHSKHPEPAGSDSRSDDTKGASSRAVLV